MFSSLKLFYMFIILSEYFFWNIMFFAHRYCTVTVFCYIRFWIFFLIFIIIIGCFFLTFFSFICLFC
eukprot:UN00990